MPLRYADQILRPVVLDRPAPPATAVPWVTTPTVVQARHQPGNYFHQICDDYFSLYWLLQTYVANPECGLPVQPVKLSPAGTLPKGVTFAPPPGVPEALALYQDGWGPIGTTIAGRLSPFFSHVSHLTLDEMHDKYAANVVCFTDVAFGTPSMSVHINGGYSFHEARSWGLPVDEDGRTALTRSFGRWFTASWLHHIAHVDLDTYRAPERDSIVMVNRPPGARHLLNFPALVEAVKRIAAPHNLHVATVEHSFEDVEAIQVFSRAIMFIGVHGAGLTNMMLMQPGSVVIELVPQDTRTRNYFDVLAMGLGIAHHAVALNPAADGFNGPFTVDEGAAAGAVDIVLRNWLTGGMPEVGRPSTRLRPFGKAGAGNSEDCD